VDQNFKISSALKDIIGRDLITDDFVAIFELVKNAFDAHATRVDIEFGTASILIADNGKGMSRNDIVSKWLFVAYSAKRTGEEDNGLPRDYRNRITIRRGFAGNKGIGRFSCDRLGQTLELYTRRIGRSRVERLDVDWTTFEGNPKEEFANIQVDLSSTTAFPAAERMRTPRENGTVLLIENLRTPWNEEKIEKLRGYLAKLVDPFQTTKELRIQIHVAKKEWRYLEGPVGNQIIDILNDKTARLSVNIRAGVIRSKLLDRGTLIYEIEEPNQYDELRECTIDAQLFFLNRSAKKTFTTRMGVQPVKFGNLFLFVNGFRVYPIGEPTDDTLGILRRKQQGSSRYLGLRDILGKVDVTAPVGMFREASSRDAGLILSASTESLYDAIMRHVFQRLERYVVTVNWPDTLDKDREDSAGLSSDNARARIIALVQGLSGTKNIKLLDYNRDLVDIINERSEAFEASMDGLAVVAEETGDQALLARVERARQRYEELKQAEAEARQRAEEEAEARRISEARAQAAEIHAEQVTAKLEHVEKQAQMLLNAQSQGTEELQLLHHQVIIYATEVQTLARRGMRRLGGGTVQIESLLADLEQISFQNSRILAVTRLATQANFKLNADNLKADLIQYMKEYVEKVSTLYGDVRTAIFDDGGLSLVISFKPIDIAIVVDNLFSNSAKANAHSIKFQCRKVPAGKQLEIVVSDDGAGINEAVVGPAKIFERGYSGSPRGSGLGLYHAKQIMEKLGGSIGLDPTRLPGKAQFLLRLPTGGKDHAT